MPAVPGWVLGAVVVSYLALWGCESKVPSSETVARSPAAAAVERYECNRCHTAEEALTPAPYETNCTGCHTAIRSGDNDWKIWKYPPDALERWKQNITHLVDVPTLTGADKRFRRDWMVEYLQSPHDVRPRLESTMPRLSMSEEDAKLVAAYFVPDEKPHATVNLDDADPEAGRALMNAENCGFCHSFGGTEPLTASEPENLPTENLGRAMTLAPDLRHTRERMTPGAVVAWLEDPSAIKPDTLMPRYDFTDEQRRDIAAFVFETELEPVESRAVPERLPVLEREVSYAEVERRVFKKVCWHCHSDPAGNNGDGGPGNTGGFGFEGRGLDLGSYEAIKRGRLNDEGRRESVLEPMADGTPRIVAHMHARHAEVAGQPVDGIRGMPMSVPPMSSEDIQLVETWIAQRAMR